MEHKEEFLKYLEKTYNICTMRDFVYSFTEEVRKEIYEEFIASI